MGFKVFVQTANRGRQHHYIWRHPMVWVCIVCLLYVINISANGSLHVRVCVWSYFLGCLKHPHVSVERETLFWPLCCWFAQIDFGHDVTDIWELAPQFWEEKHNILPGMGKCQEICCFEWEHELSYTAEIALLIIILFTVIFHDLMDFSLYFPNSSYGTFAD